MKKVLSFALVALTMGFVFVSCEKDNGEDDVKSYTLSASLDKANSFYLSEDSTNNIGFYFRSDININPFILVHGWSPKYGFGGGFTYTNCTNDTTASNYNLSAITKKGVKGSTYFISYTGTEDWGLPVEISFKDGKAYNAKECYVTNSTSAYLAIKEQKADVAVKEWTAQDKFTLTITGFNGKEKTGTIEFLLADGLNVVNTWQQVDLSKLGKVTMIKFSLSTTDMISYDEGITYYPNTPFYFCLDQLTVTE